MKFDTIIIGGGLTALTAGICLAKRQKRVAIISSGQSTLHFNSGSLDLLGYDNDGNEINHPLDAINSLPANHPYHKLGNNIVFLVNDARQLLEAASINVNGHNSTNHYRISPIGELLPTWLTFDGLANLDSKTSPWQNVILANVKGFLDFQVNFIKPALEKLGTNVMSKTFTTPKLERARQNPSEFRATNIAKYIDESDVKEIANQINNMGTADAVLLPAVFGIDNNNVLTELRKKANMPIELLATMHPSITGIRMSNLLRRHFQTLGGLFFQSDIVTGAEIKNRRVQFVTTQNMVEEHMEAQDFILATGTFMSRGLRSNYKEIWEPIFNLDIDYAKERKDWHYDQFSENQPFMSFGVRTDENLHGIKDGMVIENLYAAGSILSGNDFLKFRDHEGVDMLTALQAASHVSNVK